ncbi:MAG: ribose 5-phosphate isomerase B [Anaerolineaceae bacterium]|nr:ribose 5-phosphate isomerase B [Anaerolineaceae bacterium]
MKIIIASDHIGRPLKDVVVQHLKNRGHEPVDLGVHSDSPVDYPDVGQELAERIARGEYERGILVCGTGIGMAIVANKVPGVRAAVCHDPYSAERARKSNDAQVMTLGSQVIGSEVAKALVDIWLAAEFAGGRSAAKVEKINGLDEHYRKL